MHYNDMEKRTQSEINRNKLYNKRREQALENTGNLRRTIETLFFATPNSNALERALDLADNLIFELCHVDHLPEENEED